MTHFDVDNCDRESEGTMGDASVRLLISCVSDEFGDYREALRHALTRPNVEVKVQEDFKALGGDTLHLLEDYIARCETVVHFVGNMAGSKPAPGSVDDLLKRRPDLGAALAGKGITHEALAALTYTQWEAWLAIGLNISLVIVAPAAEAARGPRYDPTPAAFASQADHLRRLRTIDRYPSPPFTNTDKLVAQIFASAVIDALVKAEGTRSASKQPLERVWTWLASIFVPIAVVMGFYVNGGLPGVDSAPGVVISVAYWSLLVTLVTGIILVFTVAAYVGEADLSGSAIPVPANTFFEDDSRRSPFVSWWTVCIVVAVLAAALIVFTKRYSESEIHLWDRRDALAPGFIASRMAAYESDCKGVSCFAISSRFDDQDNSIKRGVIEYLLYWTDGVIFFLAIVFLFGWYRLSSAVFDRRRKLAYVSS
jgi:hypothetical protein